MGAKLSGGPARASRPLQLQKSIIHLLKIKQTSFYYAANAPGTPIPTPSSCLALINATLPVAVIMVVFIMLSLSWLPLLWLLSRSVDVLVISW